MTMLRTMNYKLRTKHGLTLTEMTVVIASIVLLAAIGLPAVRVFIHSFESESGTKSMISAALASARAMSAQKQRYVGIRFQKICLSRDTANPLAGLLEAPQYMIFIVWEEPTKMDGLTIGFRAIEGFKPVKLPDTVGVIDISGIVDNAGINEDFELSNATSFSIIFSPSGKLVIHDVRVRNKDGVYQPNNDNPKNISMDDVFNSAYNINKYGLGMFIQDDYLSLGLGKESSRNNFIIYDKSQFNKLNAGGRFSYLSGLKPIYINPYTGTIISE